MTSVELHYFLIEIVFEAFKSNFEEFDKELVC